jgi:hypothetical protein
VKVLVTRVQIWFVFANLNIGPFGHFFVSKQPSVALIGATTPGTCSLRSRAVDKKKLSPPARRFHSEILMTEG